MPRLLFVRTAAATLSWLGPVLTLCLGLWFTPALLAAPMPPVIQLDETASEVALAGSSQFFLDPSGRLGPDDIEAQQAQLPFAPRPAGHTVVMSESEALWIRFSARVPNAAIHWQLLVALPGVDEVALFYRDARGNWVTQRAGDRLPQSQWPLRGRQPALSLDTETGRDVTYLLRVQHERVPFSAPLFLQTPTVTTEQSQRAQFLLGAYFGLAALAVLVATANALVYRDRAFGTYAFYVGAMALAQAGMTGVGGLLFWPEWPGLNNPVTFFMPMLAGATGAWFVRTVAAPRQYSTLLDQLATGVILILLGVAGVDMLRPSTIGFELSTNLLVLSMALVMVLLSLAIARGDFYSRWIAVGFTMVLLGGALPVARNFGLMPSGFLSEYGLMLGSALEMPLLFYALSHRLSRQTESRARARALAVTDPLTGLASRRKLLVQLHGALARARARPGHALALMTVELANHAALARDHGRESAERALVLAAARLKAVARDIDLVARVGEQHFALLMESPCTLDEAGAMTTHVVAQGLRPSSALPGTATLRFHVAYASLPVHALDAEDTLALLLDELRKIPLDSRKTIRLVRE